MAKTTLIEKVSIITSAIRTLLTTVIVGGLGIGGWYGYNTYNATEREAQRSAQALTQARADLEAKEAVIRVKEQEIGALNTEVAKQQEEIERLDTAMRLLKVDHRMAMITVLDQTKDEATETTLTQIDFQRSTTTATRLACQSVSRLKATFCISTAGWSSSTTSTSSKRISTAPLP